MLFWLAHNKSIKTDALDYAQVAHGFAILCATCATLVRRLLKRHVLFQRTLATMLIRDKLEMAVSLLLRGYGVANRSTSGCLKEEQAAMPQGATRVKQHAFKVQLCVLLNATELCVVAGRLRYSRVSRRYGCLLRPALSYPNYFSRIPCNSR